MKIIRTFNSKSEILKYGTTELNDWVLKFAEFRKKWFNGQGGE